MGNQGTSSGQIAFVHILIPFASGIITSYDSQSEILLQVFCIVSCSLLCLTIVLGLLYKKLKLYNSRWLLGVFIYLLAFSYGSLWCLVNDTRLSANYFANKKNSFLKIKVSNDPLFKNGILRFKADVKSSYFDERMSATSGMLLVCLKQGNTNPPKLKYGDELLIPSKYTAVAAPHNPGEFDYKSWLASQHIYYQTFITAKQFEQSASNQGNPLIAFALKLRENQLTYFRKMLKNDDAFAMASTLILGYRADLSQSTMDIYSRTGTIHVLSVSGMHVGLIYLILNFLLSFLSNSSAMRKLKMATILLSLWLYVLITGYSPSILRSAIMLTVFIVAKVSGKTINGYNTLAFAAFCMLLYEPYLIWDVGFQLSFIAVMGMIAVQPLSAHYLSHRNLIVKNLASGAIMSTAAQAATFPLSVYYFHQFPLYFLLSNLFIIIPSALILYIGMLALLFKLDFLMPYFEMIINFMNAGLNYISKFPSASVSGIWIDKTQLIMLSVSLLLLILSLQRKNKSILIISLIGFFILRLSLTYHNYCIANQQKTIIFKLRRNYATAFIHGRNAVMYTDLDTSKKTFKQQIQPALNLHQIQKFCIISDAMPDQKK